MAISQHHKVLKEEQKIFLATQPLKIMLSSEPLENYLGPPRLYINNKNELK